MTTSLDLSFPDWMIIAEAALQELTHAIPNEHASRMPYSQYSDVCDRMIVPLLDYLEARKCPEEFLSCVFFGYWGGGWHLYDALYSMRRRNNDIKKMEFYKNFKVHAEKLRISGNYRYVW